MAPSCASIFCCSFSPRRSGALATPVRFRSSGLPSPRIVALTLAAPDRGPQPRGMTAAEITDGSQASSRLSRPDAVKYPRCSADGYNQYTTTGVYPSAQPARQGNGGRPSRDLAVAERARQPITAHQSEALERRELLSSPNILKRLHPPRIQPLAGRSTRRCTAAAISSVAAMTPAYCHHSGTAENRFC